MLYPQRTQRWPAFSFCFGMGLGLGGSPQFIYYPTKAYSDATGHVYADKNSTIYVSA